MSIDWWPMDRHSPGDGDLPGVGDLDALAWLAEQDAEVKTFVYNDESNDYPDDRCAP